MESSECWAGAPRLVARGRVLTLEVGDLLARLPPRCFRPGARSVKRGVAIPLEELLPGLLRGRVTVALGRLAELCPDLFSGGLGGDADLPIELPLARLVGQVEEFAEGAPPMEVGGKPVIIEDDEGEGLIAAQSPLSGVGEMIRFNLSSVLRGARGKILDGPVDPSAQVGVPIERVEEQLATGRVVFTAAQLAPGVPEPLRGAFEAAGGIEVEIPLDEVFKSLPGGDIEPAPEQPAVPRAPAVAPVSAASGSASPAAPDDVPERAMPGENARALGRVESGVLSATGGPDVFGRRILAGGPAVMLAAQQSSREGGGDAVDRVMGGFDGVSGVTGCAVVFGRDLRLWGELPGEIDPRAFREQAWEMMDEVARRGGLFGLKPPDSLTWRAGDVRATLMARGEVCVCAFHGGEDLGGEGRAAMAALLGRLLAEL